MKLKKLFTLMAVAGITLPGAAMATNGMFADGYGMVAAGMGGAATAMSEDAFGGANNPASMAFVGDRIDFGASVFSPRREATSMDFGTGSQATVQSDKNYFVVPELGYNKMMSKDLSLGVTVYGNGGMNTDYAAAPSGVNFFGNTGRLGVDLVQLVIAPTAAYKIASNHSIGISPLIGYQRFKADGVLGTNPGYDDAFGYGVRIGYMGKLTSDLTIGASYSTKVKMQKFDKYANNLLASGNGALDLAENYSVGVAYKVMPDLTMALDYLRINYGDVASIGTATAQGGFGWHDIDVWKLGAEYKYSKAWTLRAGWNHGDNPINSADAFVNIIAPGVIKDHLTMGTTYVTSTGGELTVAYTHGFENSVTGPNAAVPSSPTTISMHQDIIGVAYGWKM
ncbi:MAG: outer membrane protein transport protein [Sulfuriferula sp.]